MHITSVGTALPPNRYSQAELIAAFEEAWATEHFNPARVRRFHEAVQVGQRNLALPLEEYNKLQGFGDANDAFLRVGLELADQAIADALAQAGLRHEDVDAIYSASITGIGTPSLEARLFHRTNLRPDIKRVPIFGLGCAAGAAGLSRVYDYLRAWPDQVAVLLCVELCSLTLQRGDLSIANLISTGLFGDGAAAVVCVGSERAEQLGLQAQPKVLATQSWLHPDSERVMGWDIGDQGFKVILDRSLPAIVRKSLRGDVEHFLSAQGLSLSDIQSWVCHPGGPAVLDAVQAALECEPDALELTRNSLARDGNLSSASVLFVLRDTLATRRPAADARGIIMAMGPGFCSELVLVKW